MNVVYERCCGLDVHKKIIVACLRILASDGQLQKEIRTFGTMTRDLLALSDWLTQAGCTHVAMESTGVYWKPVYNILEGSFELLVVNVQHLKTVPGRKTDVKDAEWIAELLQHGLLKSSFIPPSFQRALRDLTRYRSLLIRERARMVNRLQKVLEDANIKLGNVATDVLGVSGRAMLQALVEGKAEPKTMAEMARGRMKHKKPALEQALTGRVKPHHCFLIQEHLNQFDSLNASIERISKEVALQMSPLEQEILLLDTIPGVNRQTAEVLLAEIGPDMSRFPSAGHLASWAGMCPGNKESAGKRLSGKTRKGSRWLRHALIEAAHGAAHTKATYLGSQYHRLAGRKGKKKALVAVGHSTIVISYHLLKCHKPYQDLGVNYFDERDRQAVQKRLVRRLENLGYEVTLKPAA